MAEPEGGEAGDMQRPAPEAVAVAQAQRASLDDMAERIGALIAIGRSIRRAAAADRIEDDDHRAAHWRLTG